MLAGIYRQLLFRVISRGFLWLIGSVTFGLLQLWKPTLSCLIFGDERFAACIDNFFWSGGVVLFFCSGVVMAVAMEAWLEARIDKNSIINVLIHILFPILLILCNVMIYADILNGQVTSGSRFQTYQLFVLLFSMVYAGGGKVHLELARGR